MIADDIRNSSLYACLSPGIDAALKYLAGTDFSRVGPGRHEIGEGCYCIVQDYTTAPREQKRYEAHRKYVDVQFIASGEELIGHADIATLRAAEDYDESRDVAWFEGEGDFVTARAGVFVILFPHDAHMPGVSLAGCEAVRKVVAKVPVWGD
jgi:YhcH/YjgK/YiaL family protein